MMDKNADTLYVEWIFSPKTSLFNNNGQLY